MVKYTQLSVYIFSVICLAIKCNATCIYDSVSAYCIFLDISAKQCNTCSSDTDYLLNAIPNSINVSKSDGACGCVLQIYETCTDFFNCNANRIRFSYSILVN